MLRKGLPAAIAGVALLGALAALLLAGRLSQSSGRPVGPAAAHCPQVSAGPPPARHGALVVGLNSLWNNDCNLAAVAAAGVTMERLELDWSAVQPTPGVWRFDEYDKEFAVAARHGITMLPLLMNVPAWAGHGWNVFPSRPAAYARFVARVVARYGPHGSFWTAHRSLAAYAIQTFELWNEPYYSNGNNGDYDPGRYARLVKAAASAGRQTDSDARFLLAAENQAQHIGSSWVWWIDALYQAVPDLNNYFDGVAVHPYGTDLTNLSFPTPGQAYNGYQQIRRVEAIHREFGKHAAGNKPVWITEIGWPTCTSGSVRCTTPAGQAANLTTVFNYARTTWKNFVQAVFVYSYDDSYSDSSDPEHDYGLTYNDGTPKPALTVFQAQAATR